MVPMSVVLLRDGQYRVVIASGCCRHMLAQFLVFEQPARTTFDGDDYIIFIVERGDQHSVMDVVVHGLRVEIDSDEPHIRVLALVGSS